MQFVKWHTALAMNNSFPLELILDKVKRLVKGLKGVDRHRGASPYSITKRLYRRYSGLTSLRPKVQYHFIVIAFVVFSYWSCSSVFKQQLSSEDNVKCEHCLDSGKRKRILRALRGRNEGWVPGGIL